MEFLEANFLKVLNPGGTVVANAISCPLIQSAAQSMRKLYSNYVVTKKYINISMRLPSLLLNVHIDVLTRKSQYQYQYFENRSIQYNINNIDPLY